MKSIITLFGVILMLVTAFTGCGSASGITPLDPPNDEGNLLSRIASGEGFSLITFTRKMGTYPEQNRELFVMKPDASVEQRLTWDTADDNHPSFSPNGRSLSFASNRSSSSWGSHDLYKYSPWGGITQLTDDAWQFDTLDTEWGPGFILAARLNTLIGAPFDVVNVIAVDPWATWEKYLNTGHVASYGPSIDKNGNTLVFAARPAGATYYGSMELYIWQRGQDAPVQLTEFGEDFDNMVFTTAPCIDFDGGVVTFQTTLWDGNLEIGYLQLDVSKPFPYHEEDAVRVTDNPAQDTEPCFSPDRKWIAFISNRDGNSELYRIWYPGNNVPGPSLSLVRLTNTKQDEGDPDWSDFY